MAVCSSVAHPHWWGFSVASIFHTDVIATDDPEVAFKDIDVAIMVGAMPRREGMERKDLLKANAKIFETQGRALDKCAKKTVKVCIPPSLLFPPSPSFFYSLPPLLSRSQYLPSLVPGASHFLPAPLEKLLISHSLLLFSSLHFLSFLSPAPLGLSFSHPPQVLVVGNPANTNALLCLKSAPSIPVTNFSCLTRLDHNRALAQVHAWH